MFQLKRMCKSVVDPIVPGRKRGKGGVWASTPSESIWNSARTEFRCLRQAAALSTEVGKITKKRLDLSYHKSWYDIWYLHLFSLPVFHVFRLDIAWLISLELKEFWAILFLIFLTWCDVVIWTFCRIAWFLFLMMGAQNHWELRRRFWLCLKTFGNKSGACAWKVPDMKDMDAAVAELGTLQQACNALASESTSHCVFQICQEFERTANAWSLRFNAGRFATM